MALENSINTNVAAFIALQNLNATNRQLGIVQNRVNTGLEVSGARDNSAIFAIAQNLRSDLGGINAIRQSLGRADSTLATAINAAEAVSDLTVQLREIAVAASDKGLDDDSRTALNNDFQKIAEQIDSVIKQAEFNGTNLLKDTPDSISAIVSVSSDGTVDALNVAGIDLTSDSNNATTGDPILIGIDNLDDLGDFDALNDQVAAEYLDLAEAAVGTTTVFSLSGGNLVVDFNNATTSNDGTNITALTLTIDIDGEGTTVQFQATEADSGVDFGTTASPNTAGINALQLSDFKIVGGAIDLEVKATAKDATSALFTTDETNVKLSDLDLTNDFDRAAAIQVVDNFLQEVNSALATFGSSARQIELQNEFAAKLSDSIETGIGNLVDADLARESAALQALQVKQQLGIQALAIANAGPQILLGLFR